MLYFFYVYNLEFYDEIFEINILNWYNIFTSEKLKIKFFTKVWNQKYGVHLI
jgi:hypothetical protein